MSAAPDCDDCFTYGSLMWADIMARVCGCGPQDLRGQQAWLPGYRRLAVRGEDYPGLVALDDTAEGGFAAAPMPVRGVLYRGLSEQALRRLDVFEGQEYERTLVRVSTAGPAGQALHLAWVYRFRAEFTHRLLDQAWSPEAFEAGGKARFMARYGGFARGS